MRRDLILALLLLLIALGLYALPAPYLIQTRLEVQSLLRGARARLLGDPPPPVEPSVGLDGRRVELHRALARREAENAALRMDLDRLTRFHEAFLKGENRPHNAVVGFALARVIAVGGGPLGDTLTLDCGAADGIEVGDGVLQGDALVGTVSQVAERASHVLLVSSPGSVIAARVGPTRERVSIHGVGHGQARAVFYAPRPKAAGGDALWTSGLLGRFPPGVAVGALLEPPREGGDPGTLEAAVALAYDAATLESVLVVRRSPPPSPGAEATESEP